MSEIGLQALSQVALGLSKKQKGKQDVPNSGKHLSPAQIDHIWADAERAIIPKSMPLLQEDDDEDTVFFLLDGITARYNSPSSWNAFLSLNPSLQPYDSAALLESHIRIFHHLRYQLPSALRAFCTAETVLALVTRDHGNSFGIFEDELGRDGEMLGYGTWTDASFFNHSCSSNLSKRRQGRTYAFITKRDISAGEELCINYIEDAVDEITNVRRKRLQAGWGFICSCSRCMHESAGAPN